MVNRPSTALHLRQAPERRVDFDIRAVHVGVSDAYYRRSNVDVVLEDQVVAFGPDVSKLQKVIATELPLDVHVPLLSAAVPEVDVEDRSRAAGGRPVRID